MCGKNDLGRAAFRRRGETDAPSGQPKKDPRARLHEGKSAAKEPQPESLTAIRLQIKDWRGL